MPRGLPTALLVALVLVIATCSTVDGFVNLHQPCRPFKCPKSTEKAVPKKDFVFTANGCGTAAMPIATDTDFSDCCNWHDACYSTCGMKKDTCEKRLDKCMHAKCEALETKDERQKCEATSKVFALGANMMGCPAYQQAQKEACTCVAEDKVTGAMRERLMHFLKENNAPAKEQEANAVYALLKKYKGKEATMFLRLLVKYPDAIKVDTSKRNFMDDMFKAPDYDSMQFASNKQNQELKVELMDNDDGDAKEHVDEHIEL